MRTSFWFVPSLMVAAAAGLAALGVWLDHEALDAAPEEAPVWLYSSSSDQARSVVSSLLSSMITMASLVFSITMVVLTLAASQFGPRLIRNFMASALTQVVLGTFAMTIVYCLIVLSAIGRRQSEESLPFATVTIAIALMAINVLLLVAFIHTLARSIVSETVIKRVGVELDRSIRMLAPLDQDESENDPAASLPPGFEEKSVRFGPTKPGYLQAVDFERLVKMASSADAVIGLYARPGDFVAQDSRVFAIFPPQADSPEVRRCVLAAIAVGAHRTPVQDLDYPIRHLVEIAVRALSPGINDPYTAVAVVHRLSASLALLMRRKLPTGVHLDRSGSARIVHPVPVHGTLVEAAFDQIRQNGADKPLLMIHLLEAFQRIIESAALPSQLDVLEEQVRIVAEDAEREIASPEDRASVRRKAEICDRALAAARRTVSASS